MAGKIDNPENDRKQNVLRSKTKSIYGLYAMGIALERGNCINRSCSQGALMQAPDQSWWFPHQLIPKAKISQTDFTERKYDSGSNVKKNNQQTRL